MKKIVFIIPIILSLFIAIIPDPAQGVGTGDEALFITVESADALIILDLSGSMRMLPVGYYMYIPNGASCGSPCESDNVATNIPFYAQKPDDNYKSVKIVSDSHTDVDPIAVSTVPIWSNPSCSGPFYRGQQTGFNTNCRRIAVAKRAIFNLLDINGDQILNTTDQNTLCLKMGYMRFYDCQVNGSSTQNKNEGSDYKSGCNTVRWPIGTSYNDLYNKKPNVTDKIALKDDYGNGSTALAGSLSEAKLYLDTLVGDIRQKYVILLTDGADSVSCCQNYNLVEGYQCGETLTIQYRKNRKSVAMAKALNDAGYKVFVVGFGGDLPDILQNTLNWMAYYGGTDNPDLPNSGDTGGYTHDPAFNTCPTSPRECYIYKDLMNKPNPIYTPCTPDGRTTGGGNEQDCYCFAQSNDPAKGPSGNPAGPSLRGYAYISNDQTQLNDAMQSITRYIKGEASYAFTAPTIPSVRMVDRDIMYISSFKPRTGVAFWEGNLIGYQLEIDGTLQLDAYQNPVNGAIWVASTPASRTIKTYNNKNFDASNLTKEDLDVGTDTERDHLISYIRSLKLGDIFHSNPVVVGSPSQFYVDDAFSGFYSDHKDRPKLIIVGANDGMLHAFSTETETGNEVWAFIPKSVLKNLQYLEGNQHHYYVDSTPKVADVWIDKDGNDQKIAGEWKTILVSGLRKGGKTYFALDITDTSNPPTYLWEFPKTDGVLNEVGQSWSEPALGRVKIEKGGNLVETWVAFIGGGFDTSMNPDWSNNVGNAFYIIDIETGGDKFFKKFSGLSNMKYSLAAPPVAVDTDLNGFIDKVYIGDLGGQMWVFDVSFNETTKKSNSLWTGRKLFVANQNKRHPIYYQPAVSFDKNRTPWVYFGTGDRENPTEIWNPNPPDSQFDQRFYAVKDDGDGSYPRNESNLKDVTAEATYTPPVDPKKGWYMVLNQSEKVLSKAAVFNQFLNFTTYTPGPSAPGDACTSAGAGVAKLYVVEYLTGNGALVADGLIDPITTPPYKRSELIGSGAPSTPQISVDLKGNASIMIRTTSDQIFSKKVTFSKNRDLLYWREVVP